MIAQHPIYLVFNP